MFMKFLKLRTDKINAGNWLPFSKVAIISVSVCVNVVEKNEIFLGLNN